MFQNSLVDRAYLRLRSHPHGVIATDDLVGFPHEQAFALLGVRAATLAEREVDRWCAAQANGRLVMSSARLRRGAPASCSSVLVAVEPAELRTAPAAFGDEVGAVVSRNVTAEELALAVVAWACGLQAVDLGRIVLDEARRACRCRSFADEELALVRELARGRSVLERARWLGRSERDCFRVMARMRNAIGVRSRVELIAHLAACGQLA